MSEQITTTAINPEPEGVDILFVQPETASTNFYWTFGNTETFNLQTTFRGNPQAVEIEAHLAAVKEALIHIVRMGGHAKPVGQQATQPAPVKAAQADGASPAPAKAPPTKAGAPMNGAPKEILELRFVKIEVVPKPEGKSELRFFEAGHKYPDIYATRATEKWIDELGWDETAFVSAVYESKGVAGYTLSDKLNTKGNPYKDIEYIKLG